MDRVLLALSEVRENLIGLDLQSMDQRAESMDQRAESIDHRLSFLLAQIKSNTKRAKKLLNRIEAR